MQSASPHSRRGARLLHRPHGSTVFDKQASHNIYSSVLSTGGYKGHVPLDLTHTQTLSLFSQFLYLELKLTGRGPLTCVIPAEVYEAGPAPPREPLRLQRQSGKGNSPSTFPELDEGHLSKGCGSKHENTAEPAQ
jgi:hypothetical protein